jgi:hypothetical protein
LLNTTHARWEVVGDDQRSRNVLSGNGIGHGVYADRA